LEFELDVYKFVDKLLPLAWWLVLGKLFDDFCSPSHQNSPVPWNFAFPLGSSQAFKWDMELGNVFTSGNKGVVLFIWVFAIKLAWPIHLLKGAL
jgi:hypothetical protein